MNVSYRGKARLVARNPYSRWKIERRVREIQDATRYLGSFSWLLCLAYYSCADPESFVRRWGSSSNKGFVLVCGLVINLFYRGEIGVRT